MKQKIVFTALPNGLGVDKLQQSFARISVAISLQVPNVATPQKPAATECLLSEMPDMLNWYDRIKAASFLVEINGKLMDPLKLKKMTAFETAIPSRWSKLFSPAIKVKAYTPPDLTETPILTLPTKNILDHIATIVKETGNGFVSDMPQAGFYRGNKRFTDISNYGITFGDKGEGVNSFDLQRGKTVQDLYKQRPFIPFNENTSPSTAFAQAGYFHGLYSHKTDKHFEKFEKPDFEFHDVLSVLSQYPKLLRMLGLVVDFEIPIKELTTGNPFSTLRIYPNGLPLTTDTLIVCPATAFEVTAQGFYAGPMPPTPLTPKSFLEKGHVKVAGTDFTLFQVDADGAAIKYVSHIDGLQLKASAASYPHSAAGSEAGLAAYNNEQSGKREGLPSLRSAGLALAKNGMAAYLHDRFVRSETLKGIFAAPAGIVPTAVKNGTAQYALGGSNIASGLLFADDLTIGFRMDAREQGSKAWRSLHENQNTYTFLAPNSNTVLEKIELLRDEGFIQFSTSEDRAIDGPHMKLSETIARWEGWSLSAPLPGFSLNEPTTRKPEEFKEMETDKGAEDSKYDTPTDVPFRLNVRPAIVPGTLPKLRFGKAYEVRLRTVDAAGNSISLNAEPDNAVKSNAVKSTGSYRRYEPVDAPFLLPANVYRDGESAEVMAIRSAEGQTPAQYETDPAHNDGFVNPQTGKPAFPYSPNSIRFVMPPRITVSMAVTLGMFDPTPTAKDRPSMKDAYSFLKERDPEVETVQHSNDIKHDPLKAAPLQNENTVPAINYLPDPLAAGVVFFVSALDPKSNFKTPVNGLPDGGKRSFYDAEAGSLDGLTFASWRTAKPFKLVLTEGVFALKKEGEQVTISLPKGHMLKLNYACYWRTEDVKNLSGIGEMMGGLNTLAQNVRDAANNGRHWMFSPWRTITFVHAVPQPVAVPNPTAKPLPFLNLVTASRSFGDTAAKLNIDADVHGPSTGQVAFEAAWTDWVDDVNNDDGPRQVRKKAAVFHYATQYEKDKYVFGDLPQKNVFDLASGSLHHFNDTKHRFVNYTAVASTRYKEYFFRLIQKNKEAFKLTQESKPFSNVNILSSARPAAPDVAYVIPTFEWASSKKDDTVSHGRGSGLRVYLKRPWYSSGEGEKLAVVVIPDNVVSAPYENLCTTWGIDPTRLTPKAGTVFTPKAAFLGVNPTDATGNLFAEDGLSAEVSETKTLPVSIAAYEVQYDEERGLYYADIMLFFGLAYFPFVRLALAAYQQHSVRANGTDCCLSKVVHADYVQIPPPRLTSITRGLSSVPGSPVKLPQITVAVAGTCSTTTNAAGMSLQNLIEYNLEPITFPKSEGAVILLDEKPIDTFTQILRSEDLTGFQFRLSHTFIPPLQFVKSPFRIRITEYENWSVRGIMALNDRRRAVFTDVYDVGLIGPITTATNATAQQIAYVDKDGAVQQWSGDKTFTQKNLTALAKAPAAKGRISGFISNGGKTQTLFFRGADDNLYEVGSTDNSTWKAVNRTALNKAPLMASHPAAFLKNDKQYVAYRDAHGQLIQLKFDKAWSVENVTAKAMIALDAVAAGNPAVYSTSAFEQNIVYRDAKGHVHKCWLFEENVWKHLDLTHRTGTLWTAFAVTDPVGYATENGATERIVFVGRDRQVYEFKLNIGAQLSNLTASAGVSGASLPAGALAVYTTGNTAVPHVVYRGADNQVHELFFSGGGWNHNNLCEAAGAPLAFDDPAGYASQAATAEIQNVVYTGVDGHLHRLSAGAKWTHQDLGSVY